VALFEAGGNIHGPVTVKENIQAHGGRIIVRSRAHHSTNPVIHLPLERK
jgi:signal transduction histidine kinase